MFRRLLPYAVLLTLLASAKAAPPAWWASRGATNGSTPNDSAPVSQGQLKHFTYMAVLEMNSALATSGGAGAELDTLIATWNASKSTADDKVVMTVGQLKWIAAKVHSRLQYIGWCDTTPTWITLDADNQSIATLGQLKTIFAFNPSAPDPNSDYDGDGLTNAQEMGTIPPTNHNNTDSDGDGIPDGEDPSPLSPATVSLATTTTLLVWSPAE